MKISELAKLSQISPRMLRYYEQKKLLYPERTVSGYRQYSSADIERVKLIHQLNIAGLTLATIGKVLPCWHQHKRKFSACLEFKAELENTLKKIEKQISILKLSRYYLKQLLQYSNSGE